MSSSTLRFTPLLLALSLVLPAAASDDDWPQWRGPHRDATTDGSGLIQEWPADGPEVLWRVDVGNGFSGVVVSGGELYTMWDEGGVQVLACLDAASGESLWSTPIGDAFQHPYGNGPRSTPLIDGDVVFATGTSGKLLAANRHTGETVWEHDMVKELGARLPSYGYASSPLLVGKRLFVETAGEGAAYSAFDSHTGKLLWSAQDDAPAYSSPTRVTFGGVDQVLFWSAGGVHAIAPETGEELWSYPWRTDCPVTGDPLGTGTPLALDGDRLLLSSGSGTAVLAIGRGEEGRFHAEPVWESKVLRNDVNSSLVLGNYAYGFDLGTLACIDVRTGRATWAMRKYRKGSLIAAGEQLIVLGEGGEVALLAADPAAFEEKSVAPVLEGKSWTSPTLAGGRLYLRNHEELVCVNMRP